MIDNALTRPWTITKKYLRNPDKNSVWRETVCAENNHHVVIGKENYFLSADGHLMLTDVCSVSLLLAAVGSAVGDDCARSAADGGKTLRAGDELKMTIEAQRRARRRLDREQDQVQGRAADRGQPLKLSSRREYCVMPSENGHAPAGLKCVSASRDTC